MDTISSSPAEPASAPPSTNRPAPIPTPPHSPPQDDEIRKRTMSTGSVTSSTRTAHTSRQEYLASLHVPSGEEIATISDIQRTRAAELKRRSRDVLHQSVDLDGASSPDLRPPSSSGGGQSSSRPGHGRHRSSLSNFFHRSKSGRKGGDDHDEPEEDRKRDKAATLIQRTYRGYRTRREMAGLGLDASTRWMHAVREAQFRELTTPRARLEAGVDGNHHGTVAGGTASIGDKPGLGGRTTSAAMRNWKKAATIARRGANDADEAADGSSSSSSSSSSSDESESEGERKRKAEAKARRKKDAKMMGLQYFLEMVDLKHRYGSNLRTYHEEWKKADTNENFFYWLDHGEGRYVDMEACPRERLDRERVRYLSREERQHYLVKVDEEGRLCWAKNGARIDTTEQWKDSIHGIVPADDPTPAYTPLEGTETRMLGDASTGDDASSSSDSDTHHPSREETEAARAAKPPPTKKVSHLSASTLVDKLLRKSVRKNTWIFVADTSFRLYVGLKNSGAFQHSSFLAGSRISAAGLIKIKSGRLASLSPLSGHYRPPASNFRAFVRSLKEEGVDMRHVSISKSYAILVGLETYVKTKNKGKAVLKKVTDRKERLVKPEEVRRKEELGRDGSESAKRESEAIAREEREREENRTAVQVMGRLGIRSPEGQRGG